MLRAFSPITKPRTTQTERGTYPGRSRSLCISIAPLSIAPNFEFARDAEGLNLAMVKTHLTQHSRTAGNILPAATAVLIFVLLLAYRSFGDAIPATSANDFLNSIGADAAIAARGESLDKTLECVRFLGLRWFRSGPEDRVALDKLIYLHKETGARYSWGLGSGGSDLGKLIETGKQLATAGALLAFEGPNEPNNWGITYQGEKGGGHAPSWLAVAKLQRDLYQAVKTDPLLQHYPVWSISENGAEVDNVGLQFLRIPHGANTLLPEGTRFADYANVHNYIYHPNSSGLEDNKTWNATEPTAACKVDGLYGEYGLTWAHHYAGYSGSDLVTLPRVTTETGCTIDDKVTEHIHALNLLSMYLDQFKRGWSYTAVYLLRDRVDEGGNQKFGFYRPDYTPREAALYLHNLTTILADRRSPSKTGKLEYSIPGAPATVHDMLLQKGDGTFELVVWGERLQGNDQVEVQFGAKVGSLRLYDPTVDVSPARVLTKISSVSLTLSDHPVILELTK